MQINGLRVVQGGLNDAAIRDPKLIEYKAGLLLMKIHHPNVYMQHGLFPEQVQRARHMRLAGSFYTIDLVGAPAFRVFVEDRGQEGVTQRIPDSDIKLVDAIDSKPGALALEARQLTVRLPERTSTLLFGVERTGSPRVVVMQGGAGKLGTCEVPAIENPLHMPEVHACALHLDPSRPAESIAIGIASGERLKVFEPAVTRVEQGGRPSAPVVTRGS